MGSAALAVPLQWERRAAARDCGGEGGEGNAACGQLTLGFLLSPRSLGAARRHGSLEDGEQRVPGVRGGHRRRRG